ncbi:hypothetical protein BHE74_00049461 [Ensete ventricosum]|nr:hypothetical protein BHE74_00049461 [Ensete ventricosum]RZS22571.1 hypothetical protein BHM03_00055367 [Ensete ventricosum]
MSETARSLQETQNPVPTSVPNSGSMDSSIGGPASGTPTSAAAPLIASTVQGAATFSSTSDSGIASAVPLPFIQPPGVSLMVSQVEPTAVTAGSLQPGSSMVAESSSFVGMVIPFDQLKQFL